MSVNPESLVTAGSSEGGLAHRAYVELEELIVTLQIRPGSFLSELALSKQLGIGRTPIREALLRLSYEGLVVIVPRRGVFVTEIDVNEHFRMIEFRREVERLVACLACHRATSEECANLAQIAREMEDVAERSDSTRFIRIDQRMDQAIYAAARNPFASKALRTMSSLTRRFWFRYHKDIIDVPRCARLHARIAQAVSERDTEKASEHLSNLLDYIEHMTHASMSSHHGAESRFATTDA